MSVSCEDFCRRGAFGPLGLGNSRRALLDWLGDPELFGPQPVQAEAEIWRYGSFEFYFPAGGDGLSMIFSDHLAPLRLPAPVMLDPWIIRAGLRLEEAQDALDRAGAAYRDEPIVSLNAIDLIFDSAVTLRFWPVGSDSWELGGLWLRG
jgi:hypothetical protein